MKTLLKIALLPALLASCTPISESTSNSTRYHAFSDSRIASGGTYFLINESMEKKAYPTKLEKEAEEVCKKHLSKKGFNPTYDSMPNYVAKISFGFAKLGEAQTHAATFHLWDFKGPNHEYLWKGSGYFISLPNDPRNNDELWIEALKVALKSFPY